MAKNNEAKVRFTAETAEFNANIKTANAELGALRAELTLNATQMKETGETADKLAERQELLAQQLEAAGDKTENLRQKLAVAEKYYGTNSDEALNLKKQVTAAATAEEKIRQELGKVNAKLEEQTEESKQTETALDKLEKTISEQESTLKDLQREYKNAVITYGQNSNAAEKLKNEIEELSTELNENKTKLNTAESAFGELEKAMKDAGKAADTAGNAVEDAGKEAADSAGGWTVVKDVIADLASQAVQKAADAFKDLMLNGEAALDKLQVKTGMSSKAMEGMGDAAYAVFNSGWGESIDDVTESMSTVYTMMGDMDFDHLQQYTENAMTLADVWGYDVNESIRAVNALTNQFGVNSEDAFDLIVQGAQAGLDQNGDMLDTINEYSVQFKQAGFSAEEMFNMLSNGVAEGVWSVDKLGDAVKEYNIRATDGTVADALMENRKQLGLTKKEAQALGKEYGKGGDTSKEAMKKTLDMVLSVEDETERYKLGVSLFGTMWEDLGEDAVKALFDTEGGITATNNAMSQTKTDAYDNLATSLETLGRTLKNEILTPIVDSITPAVKDIVDWCNENMSILEPIIVGVATAFGVLAAALAISGIIAGVQKAMALLNATLLANPIVLIIALIAGLVAAFVYLWNNCESFRQFWINLWNVVKAWAISAWQAICNWFSVAWAWIQGVWAGASAWFGGIWEGIKSFFAGVPGWFMQKFSLAWAWIKSVWAGVTGWFSGVWQGISGAFAAVGSWFGNIFRTAWNNIKSAWSAVTSWFSSKWTAIKNTFSSVGSWFKSKFTTAWTNIKDVFSGWGEFFSDLWTQIKDKFSDIGSNIGSAISDTVQSGINGVLGWIEGTLNKAIRLINGAIDVVNKVPGVEIGKIEELSIPKLASGGVLRNETAFIGGEYPNAFRNPEIVTPQSVMRETFADTLSAFLPSGNAAYMDDLVGAIEDLANRAINMYIGDRQVAVATAGASDRVSGKRLKLKERGLAL